jgi:hypothetical protein
MSNYIRQDTYELTVSLFIPLLRPAAVMPLASPRVTTRAASARPHENGRIRSPMMKTGRKQMTR